MASEVRKSMDVVGTSASKYTLTTSYVAGTVARISAAYQLILDVSYTMGTSGSANEIYVKVEYANPIDDNAATIASTEWIQETFSSISGGTDTLTKGEHKFVAASAVGTYDRYTIDIPTAAKFIRVSVKEVLNAGSAGNCHVRLTYSEVSGS